MKILIVSYKNIILKFNKIDIKYIIIELIIVYLRLNLHINYSYPISFNQTYYL